MADRTDPPALDRFTAWVAAEALPRWAADGFDRTAGCFHERLDLQGRPLGVPHRSMVQARQIYVFAEAASLGWLPEGGALAEAAMASLLRHWADEGEGRTGFAFSIDPASRAVHSPVRDAYGHAFILFALAALHRLTSEPGLLDVADRTLRFMDETLADPAHGGLFDAAPISSRHKRQNPHMHLLEALLFLEEAAPGRGYGDRAQALVSLFDRRLFDADRGVLPEHFGEDWSAHPDADRAALWEPGHHFEWAWLLDRHAALAGTAAPQAAQRLYDAAVRHGLSPDARLFDEVDARSLAPVRHSHRLWPHTEAIKAAGVRAGDPAARDLAERMAATLLTRFLDRPFSGGWIDHHDADGHPLVDYVPASSLYHLMLAAVEARRCFAPPSLAPAGASA